MLSLFSGEGVAISRESAWCHGHSQSAGFQTLTSKGSEALDEIQTGSEPQVLYL